MLKARCCDVVKTPLHAIRLQVCRKATESMKGNRSIISQPGFYGRRSWEVMNARAGGPTGALQIPKIDAPDINDADVSKPSVSVLLVCYGRGGLSAACTWSCFEVQHCLHFSNEDRPSSCAAPCSFSSSGGSYETDTKSSSCEKGGRGGAQTRFA